MKFNKFKHLVQTKVKYESKGNRTLQENLMWSDSVTELHHSAIHGITRYFNIIIKDFEKEFLKRFSEGYGLRKGDQVFFFSKKSPDTSLKDFMLYVNNGKNIKTYLLQTSSGSLTITLPLYIDTKKFDNPDGLDDDFHTDWTKLIEDYPKVYDILWDIVEDNLANNKARQTTLIQQMIEKNKQEIELLKNPKKIKERIAELTKENEKNAKDISDIQSGDFEIFL